MKNIVAKSVFILVTLFVLTGSKVSAQGCVAGFTAADSSGVVSFTNTSVGWAPFFGGYGMWDFGDGSYGTSTGMSGIIHTYSAPGMYYVCLTIADSSGCSDTFCDSVWVASSSGGSCNADFSYTIDTCDVTFADMSTASAGVVSWSWSFGDGTSSTLANPTHSYSGPGSWSVTLTTTASDGCVDMMTVWIYLPDCGGGAGGCSASYTWVHDSTMAYTILLTNTSSGGPSTSYLWDFGDGATSTLAYPSHVYAGAGTYVVCVTVSEMLCTDTYCDSLAVTYKTATPFSINVVSPVTAVNPAVRNTSYTVFPNPFQGELNISLNLRESAPVTFELIDIAGRVVSSQKEGFLSSGSHASRISTAGVAPGIYVLRITAGTQTFTQKVIAR